MHSPSGKRLILGIFLLMITQILDIVFKVISNNCQKCTVAVSYFAILYTFYFDV